MWALWAFGSALCAGASSVLAKCGIRKTDSTLATALRTVVVLVMAWAVVLLAGAQKGIAAIPPAGWIFLVLSGLATGASWLCYFRALQLGDVNRVVPVDKLSTVLTILLAFAFLGEEPGAARLVCTAAIGAGSWLMAWQPGEGAPRPAAGHSWLFYALLSAFFAALTSILGKPGMAGIDSNLGTAIRTAVVLVMAWAVALATGRTAGLSAVSRKEGWFIALSGLVTGGSWLCYFRALQLGPASAVAPIDKLSILVTVAFSRLALGERLSRRAAVGLALLVAGTLGMLAA